MNAGVGAKKDKDELPTTGFWFWKDVDQEKIAKWVFKNRANIRGMLYGAAEVPSGAPAF